MGRPRSDGGVPRRVSVLTEYRRPCTFMEAALLHLSVVALGKRRAPHSVTRAARGPLRSSRRTKRRSKWLRRIALVLVLVGVVGVAAVAAWVFTGGDMSAIAS